MNITMVGTGYVGLVSGAGLADFGMQVICVDKDTDRIKRLNKGEIPFYEPGLEELVTKNVKNGRLSFTTNLKMAVERSLVVFIAVGTPDNSRGQPDLSQIEEVRSCDRYPYVIDAACPFDLGDGHRLTLPDGEEVQVPAGPIPARYPLALAVPWAYQSAK